MIKNSSKQTGSAHVIIIGVVVAILIGALGFVFWRNFMQSPSAVDKPDSSQVSETKEPKTFCDDMNGASENAGKFCNESIGVEFKIPEVFVGKFVKAENYSITKGEMENTEGVPAGKSLEFYEAVVGSEEEMLTLSVAKEPIRSGYSSLAHALRKAYFNAETKNLHLVNDPISRYDSATDSYKMEGSISEGDPVPSFDASGVKVYKGQNGDAGVATIHYLFVSNDNIVVIKVKHSMNPMNSSTIDFEKTFNELDNNLKLIKTMN